jgi:hypothetical protein
MDHPTIVNAFANAKKRMPNNPMIYMSFKRTGIFYKDTYCILTGTWDDVDDAIQKNYKEISEEKEEDYFDRGDHNNLLDTPFDTWCCGECTFLNCDDKPVCDEKTNVKCGSHWVSTEYKSKGDLQQFIDGINRGYNDYSIEYM